MLTRSTHAYQGDLPSCVSLACGCQNAAPTSYQLWNSSDRWAAQLSTSPDTCIMAPMLATFSVALGSQPAIKIVNSSAAGMSRAR